MRRALAYAYPYRAAWAANGQIPGVTRLPASNIMAPDIPGRVAYNPLPGHPPGTTDPGGARALLAAADKLNFPIRFAYDADVPPAVAVMKVVVRALAAAGFKPEPVSTSSASYIADIANNPNAEVNVRSGGWCSDWPSGGAWLPQEFAAPGDLTSSFNFNIEEFSKPAVDARISAIELLPLIQQPSAWNDLDRFIETTYFPVIPLAYYGPAMTRGSRVHNDFADTVHGMPTWKDLWLG